MSDFTDYEITETMRIYGGSFVKGLADLYRQADASNKKKLMNAFPEYFEKYTRMTSQRLEHGQ